LLVTSGGTAEPIDGVRVLTNTSTGATGALLADHFARHGHDVVLLRARNAVRPEAAVREEIFGSFSELDASLTRLLGAERFDAVIHAAAVGDFGVESVETEGRVQAAGYAKLDSGFPPLLRLRRQPKLVDTLRARSAAPLQVVAFKLTSGADAAGAAAEVGALFAHSAADLVVQNDTTARNKENGAFPADIYRPDGTVAANCATRRALAHSLEELLVKGAPTR
jgi:phosphopantothenoylcysteine decarboxylase/phosphopantothenate--cysteine ligase